MQYSFDSYLDRALPFEREMARLFDGRKPITIFEVGACEGEDSIRLRRRFPHARIHVFEPVPRNVAKIHGNFAKYGVDDVHVHNVALSDTDGHAELHVSTGHPEDQPRTDDWDFGNKSSSLLAPKEHLRTHSWITFDEKIEVTTERLDTFCKSRRISKVDFLYMDVQGAELMVLAGAGRLIGRIGAVWLEVEQVELYAGQPLRSDVEAFMQRNGFTCVLDAVGAVSGDQLYVGRRLLKRMQRKQRLIALKAKMSRWVRGLQRKP